MIDRTLADGVVLVHLGFVLFVLGGGCLVLRWRRLQWLHLPAFLWAAWVEFADWYCPLTVLEDWLRQRGGEAAYHSDFIEHYVSIVLYPDLLTRRMEIVLGVFVLALNFILYAWIWSHGPKPRRRSELQSK